MNVLFDASVILAGLNSPTGASGVLLQKVGKGEMKGKISALIFGEVVRHASKIDYTEKDIGVSVMKIFKEIAKAPAARLVEKYLKVVIDEGDAHVLAAGEQENCDTLVSLDKKHVLIMKGKVKGLTILSPGELLMKLKKKGIAPLDR